MGPARPTPNFGFWLLAFGFGARTSAIQNPKSKIQNAAGWVPDTTGPGTRRPLPGAPLGSDGRSGQTSPEGQRRPPDRTVVRPWPVLSVRSPPRIAPTPP